MSLVISHLDSYPEPQDGEATIVLSVNVAQPKAPGEAEGWRVRAACAETERVVGRWMSDCPLSAVASAVTWLGMHPWEIIPDDTGYDYAFIMERAERPATSDLHVRDLLDRIATNLPKKTTNELVNPVTGARIRRPLALPAPAPEPVEDEVAEDDVDSDDDDGEDVAAALEADRVERDRILKKALKLALAGGDVDKLAGQVERRADAALADTFRTAFSALDAKPPVVKSRPVPVDVVGMSPEAEAEVARFAVGDEAGVREKLDRTHARAAREHARVERAIAEKAARDARAAAAIEARVVAEGPVEVVDPAPEASKKPASSKRKPRKSEDAAAG